MPLNATKELGIWLTFFEEIRLKMMFQIKRLVEIYRVLHEDRRGAEAHNYFFIYKIIGF